MRILYVADVKKMLKQGKVSSGLSIGKNAGAKAKVLKNFEKCQWDYFCTTVATIFNRSFTGDFGSP
jgi:hypothetical protein